MRKSILVALSLVPSLALASGYALPNTNPRDLAMSASAVAAQRDSGAALTMPAALARLEGPSARVFTSVLNIFNDWSGNLTTAAGPISGSEEMDLRFTPLPSLSVAYGGRFMDRGWGVGLGLDPFGGGAVFWDGNWEGRYRIVSVDRQVLRGGLTAGVEVVKNVRVGGGVVYYYTMEELQQKFPVGAFVPGAPDATGTIDLSGGAFSFDLSAEATVPGFPLTIAVDYKHQAVQELEGDLRWNGVPPPLAALPQGAILRNQDASQKLTIPNVLNVGLAYQVTKPLLLTATYTFDRWEVYAADHFFGTEPGAQLRVARDYGNGHVFRFGAEYAVSNALEVRAGFQRDTSGLDERTYSPTLPDASSWAGSLGATYRFGRGLSVDAGVFYALMDEVESENNSLTEPAAPGTEGTFPGKYDISALIYGVSIGWTPGASGPNVQQ